MLYINLIYAAWSFILYIENTYVRIGFNGGWLGGGGELFVDEKSKMILN